jgi:hypothetical protein
VEEGFWARNDREIPRRDNLSVSDREYPKNGKNFARMDWAKV